MKIAVLSSHTPSLFWFRMDMMQEFISHGHTVVAIGNEDYEEWHEKFKEKNITYIQADIVRNGINPYNDLKTLLSLYKILKQQKPDKLFTYQAKTVIYGSIVSKILGIDEIYPLIAGCGSIFLANNTISKILRPFLKLEYKIALSFSKKVFFQNIDDVLLFTSLKMVKREKVVMLNGSGVDLERFREMPLPKKDAFLCTARLIRDKGIVEYLEAARIVKSKEPDTRFMLVGPFDTNPSALKEQQLQKYISNGVVEYFGEQADVIPFIEQCSIFVLPSYREGTPKTVLEAMSCGRAIITTDAPGCRETVTDGVNGLLVPVKDVDSLAEAMLKLLSDRQKVETMAMISRKIAEEKFDVKKVNKKVIDTMSIPLAPQEKIVI